MTKNCYFHDGRPAMIDVCIDGKIFNRVSLCLECWVEWSGMHRWTIQKKVQELLVVKEMKQKKLGED